MAIQKVVRIPEIGAGGSYVTVTVERTPVLGLVVNLQGVIISSDKWEELKEQVDEVLEEVKR